MPIVELKYDNNCKHILKKMLAYLAAQFSKA